MISPILDCFCGSTPKLVRRAAAYWYQCRACGETGHKAPDLPAAARLWNDKIERRKA